MEIVENTCALKLHRCGSEGFCEVFTLNFSSSLSTPSASVSSRTFSSYLGDRDRSGETVGQFCFESIGRVLSFFRFAEHWISTSTPHLYEPNPCRPSRGKIDKLRDFTDSEFAPETSFVKVVKSGPYLIMDDAGDRSFTAGGNGRRKNNKTTGKEAGQFGLQTPNFEGKKGSVKNWRPLAKSADQASTVVSGASYADLWVSLKEATDLVFRGENVRHPFESLYNKVELICVSRQEATVFKDLHMAFKGHISEWMNAIEARSKEVDDQAFLQHVEEQWQDLCRKIKLIRCIFLVLDRTYCLQRSDVPSIWDMGIAMCRQSLMETEESEAKIYAGLLSAVERERNGDQVDRHLLKNVIRMLSDLTLYESRFEEKFIAATKNLYSADSRRLIEESDIPAYLKYVSTRLDQEENRFEAGMGIGYLQISTRKKLIPTVEQELIQAHQTTMIAKGTDLLIDANRSDDMTLMFNLLARTPTGLQELCRAFCEYIKKRGRVIVMDDTPEKDKDKDMVPAMLDLKSKTDDILQHCFRNQSIFKDAAREGFEHFINQRANKPAEMIAKFVDSKLKTGNKEVTEEQLDNLMDRLLILFRYIHGKDVFEAFYKKDLAKRLLLQLSASVDSEKLMLQKLKTECGSAFTARLEGMFRDVENSKEELSGFEQFSGHPSKRTPKASSIDFAASILTHGIWPTYVPSELTLPEEMNMFMDAFQQFYVGRHSGRKLQWLANLGQCRINATYATGKKDFQVSQMQAVVLLLFNDLNDLSFDEIQKATKIETDELKRVMASLSHVRMMVLNKSGAPNVISVHDSFSYNPEFKSKTFRVKINAIQAQETPEEEQKTQEGVFADRQYQVDAAIVRIMKTRKSLKHALLVAEIYKQLRFPVTPNDLKKRIESLIERDYMARDREDQTLYNYTGSGSKRVPVVIESGAVTFIAVFFSIVSWDCRAFAMNPFATGLVVALVITLVQGLPFSRVKRQFRFGAVPNSFNFLQAATCLKNQNQLLYRNVNRPRATQFDLLAGCQTFVRCNQGTVSKTDCPTTTYFNVVSQVCEPMETRTVENCALDTKGDFVVLTTPQPSFNSTKCQSATEYSCANGVCMAKELFCDNKPDCADSSDELLCSMLTDPLRSPDCDKNQCQLPDCYCSLHGTAIPDDLPVNQVPQMVILQFDDPVNDNNIPMFDAFFSGNRSNPGSQCGIKATFFISHEYNNYQYTEKLAKDGHEIALKGIDNDRTEAYWTKSSEDKLQRDFVTERRIISKFARIPEATMQGMRVPFLRGSGNAQFSMMAHNGIRWDSSLSAEPLDIPVWPYTLNYKVPHKCYPPDKQVQCPARSFPGLWEIPLNQIVGTFDETCSILGSCTRMDNVDDVVDMLNKNFDKHYSTNRAPLVLSMSTNWMVPSHFMGLMNWVDNILATHKDVFFVTATQAISWIQNPTPVASLGSFAPWKCSANNSVPVCEEPHGCTLDGATPAMRGSYLITCEKCPSFYPDFGIPDGEILDA
ncbi:Cullin-4A [Hypsibius exemplaris]|uniref:Cullin-4 n=1 Tax=Hypsibius exemplaris TaxID=2072580 RepID=A0A1W0WLY2_HYPEX|nr:Cullin-4A [Hypsibius exemplaris]